MPGVIEVQISRVGQLGKVGKNCKMNGKTLEYSFILVDYLHLLFKNGKDLLLSKQSLLKLYGKGKI